MNRFDRIAGGYLLAALILLAILAWPSQGWSRTAGRGCPLTADVDALLKNWGEMLKRSTPSDPSPIVGTYEPKNAVLLPTCANGPSVGEGQITDYFKIFLKDRPEVEFKRRFIGGDCTIAFASGTYIFTLLKRGGQKLSARYTYVFEHRNAQWLIVQHHSSLELEPPQACPPKQ